MGLWPHAAADSRSCTSATLARSSLALVIGIALVGLLGYGKRRLDRPSPSLAYLAEGSYPVYVLHQTVIVVIAFYLVGWAVWQPLQWLALLALSVLGTFALYEGVRRWSVTRFLFGMRRKQRRPAEAGKSGRTAVGSEKTTTAAR